LARSARRDRHADGTVDGIAGDSPHAGLQFSCVVETLQVRGTTRERLCFMSSEIEHESGRTPPGGGRWDHETMREASLRPISGPGSTDTLAASGGLELPAHRAPRARIGPVTVAEEPIPGERDASTLMYRQPGSIGGRFSGADTPHQADPARLMDEKTIHDRELEGGGAN
jgi:hypothetical protein